ncbi:hypothetical protein K474DRAFT_1503526 [Panus rudis PR-1116 ss-1]|nr:hypothetical protein K474DRAFT_1503526 [Panus rudis PR-1116 ss-1]
MYRYLNAWQQKEDNTTTSCTQTSVTEAVASAMSASITQLLIIFKYEATGTTVARSHFKKYLADVMLQDLPKIVDALYEGAGQRGNEGSRIWPPGTSKDKRYGVRLDWGSLREVPAEQRIGGVRYVRTFNMQINKDPENQALKEASEKDRGTHQKRIVGQIPLDENLKPLIAKETLPTKIQSDILEKTKRIGF